MNESFETKSAIEQFGAIPGAEKREGIPENFLHMLGEEAIKELMEQNG